MGQEIVIKRIEGLVNEGIMGRFIPTDKLIVLDATLKGHDLEHTLLHEIGHAIIHRNSTYQALSPILEEVIVDTFATCLLECFALSLRVKKK